VETLGGTRNGKKASQTSPSQGCPDSPVIGPPEQLLAVSRDAQTWRPITATAPEVSRRRDRMGTPIAVSPKRVQKGTSETCTPYKATTVFPTEGVCFPFSSFSSPPTRSLENLGHAPFCSLTCKQGTAAVQTVPGGTRVRPPETHPALTLRAIAILTCGCLCELVANRNRRGYKQTNPRCAIRLTNTSPEQRLGRGRPASSSKSGERVWTSYGTTGQRR